MLQTVAAHKSFSIIDIHENNSRSVSRLTPPEFDGIQCPTYTHPARVAGESREESMRVYSVFLAAVLTAATAAAQGLGGLAGSVTDASGAAVPKATVTATETTTG